MSSPKRHEAAITSSLEESVAQIEDSAHALITAMIGLSASAGEAGVVAQRAFLPDTKDDNDPDDFNLNVMVVASSDHEFNEKLYKFITDNDYKVNNLRADMEIEDA